MPLPVGFKVNGSAVNMDTVMPPRIKKIIALLDKLPMNELLTSSEVSTRVNLSLGGTWICHRVLSNYREKVDRCFFWGSRKSIARLRKQLSEPEESHAKN